MTKSLYSKTTTPLSLRHFNMLAARCCRPTRISFASASSDHHQSLFLIPSNTHFLQPQRALESTIISSLNGCTTFHHLKHVHAHLLRAGLSQSCFLLTKLIRTLSNLNLPIDTYALRLFDSIHQPNSFLYTALIRGYSLHGPTHDAFLVYSRMRKAQMLPLTFTFSALFKASTGLGSARVGAQVHAQIIVFGGFHLDLFVNNTVMDMYLRCGLLDDARKVFDEMPSRDVISWTGMIVGYVRQGDMGEAEQVFDGLVEKDMVAWTAMVMGYAQNGRPRDALRIFEQMQGSGVGTDEVTLVGVISACAQLGGLTHGWWIRDIAKRTGFDQNVVVGSALIDMFSKCGSLDEAWNVFDGMKEKNVFTYSAMIVGFAMHGQAYAAMQLFSEMEKTETKPNGVTFIGVLTACSHAGYVNQGRKYFRIMQEDYGIAPTADHYACMIDLLGRAGFVDDAYELIRTMPLEVKPHGGVWGALLGSCRIHNRPDIAKIAAHNLFELEPSGIGNYVVLSNIYASAGQWEEVVKIRKVMRDKGLKKNPACSWVEGKDGGVHEFFAGDQTHPKFNEIMLILEDLLERIKRAGSTPILTSVVYDVSDEEKERLLKMHSEKLALAFGMITTGPDSFIRIAKNLRMCEDCHSFMREASKITGREIVVRDNLRFHHFSNGVCSCGNFW